MNDYFTKPAELAPVTKARSVDFNNLATLILNGFDKLPTELALKSGTVNYAVDTGNVANAYVATLASKITAYADGLEVKLRPTRDNGGACTLNVNGLGAIPIKRIDGTDPGAKDILANGPIVLRYSSANNAFYLPPAVYSHVIAAAASATAAAASAAASSQSAQDSAGYAVASAGFRDASQGYSQAASGSATLASQWATTMGATVAATDYSAKEWAIGTTTRGTSGSAKDWATYTGAFVNGADYSAKEWAVGVFVRGKANGGSAKDWATRTGGTVDNAEFSAKEYAQGAVVPGGSAKTWAIGTTRGQADGGSAKDWANYIGGTVDESQYSAKHWAQQAAAYSLPFGDSVALLKNTADPTKLVRFALSGLSANVTRTITIQNKDGTLALLGDIMRTTFPRAARTANTVLDAAINGSFVDITAGTFTQTFVACATLGSGWFVILRNSGTGDITLDPNGAELIDGLTSYIMYPGEARLIICDGAQLRSFVLSAFYREFPASASFPKPPGYTGFLVDIVSGGQGGNSTYDTNYGFGYKCGGGGGGGGRWRDYMSAASLPAVVNVVVGAGSAGVQSGLAAKGGDSSFGHITVTGAGTVNNSYGQSYSNAGNGGGIIVSVPGDTQWRPGSPPNSGAGGSAIWGGGSGAGHPQTGSYANALSGGHSMFGAGGGGYYYASTSYSSGGVCSVSLAGIGGLGAASPTNGGAGQNAASSDFCGNGGGGGGYGGAGGFPGGGGGGGYYQGGNGANGVVRVKGII